MGALHPGTSLALQSVMDKQILKDAVGWGFCLWLFGYLLGVVLFAFVPASLIGWIIAPVGLSAAVWVASRKLKGGTLTYYGLVALAWLLIAALGDYLFIVIAFKPPDGYYKTDVYLYYALTVAIPLAVGWRRTSYRDDDRVRT
jgi:hypothetical protein